MASVIKVKRSTTSNAPSTLNTGELSYSFGVNAKKLYIGGVDGGVLGINGVGAPIAIGGEYYTSLIDDVTAGTVAASKVVIVDSSKKVNEWLVGNLTITGSTNTIASTNTDGNIVLTPAGAGKIVLDGQYWPNALGSADTYLKTDASGNLSWAAIPSGSFTIAGDSGSDTFSTGGTLTFTGTNPVQTAITDDTVTISVDDASTTTKGIASFSSDNFAVTSGAVTIKDGGVSNAELVNSSITINSTSVSLGGSITGLAVTSGTLAQFAATSSSDLAGVISDETGSGSLVFATSPSLTTPSLGVATATSINKVTITAPATGSTLTIADGKTLTVNNTLTFTGTDSSSVAFGAGGTVTYTSDKLSVFAATTSDELRGVISDETGTGALVFATSPSLTTPSLGVATATSITATTDNVTIAAATGGGNVVLQPTGVNGVVSASSKRITNVATPTDANDAANKAYVDAVKTGLDVKDSVRLASTGAELVATYDNGTSGVGATLTNAGTQAALQLDGITVVAGNRVLIKNQTTNPEWNGIYTVTTVGTGSTNWVLTRATDFDSDAEVTGGAFTFVEEGNTQADNGYVVSTNGAITVGTTGITWVQFSGAGQIVDGDGLLKSGNTLSVRVDNSTIEITSDILNVKDAGITYAKIQNVDALSVVGNATNTAGVADEITAATDHQVLRRSGSTIGFGAIALNQAAAVTGTLVVGNGGTGATTFAANGILYGNNTDAIQVTAAGTAGYFLQANGPSAAPSWTDTVDGGTY